MPTDVGGAWPGRLAARPAPTHAAMLVNCAAYQHGRKVGDIPIREIPEYLERPASFVWVAIMDPDAAELESLQQVFGLHELAVEDAQHGHQRPKIEEYGQVLFVVVQTLEMREGGLEPGEVAIFVGAQFVLSVRRNMRQGFADVRRRCELEPELLGHGPGYVLYALVDTVVDRYFPLVDALEDDLERLEDRLFRDQATGVQVEALYELKRRLMSLKHAAGPLLEASAKLHGGRVPPVCADLQEYFRDVYDHLVRLNQSIDTLRDMVTTAISANLALITIQESEVTKRLAAYAALVAVPTLIAGVYGMNFAHMPEVQWEYGYPLALGVMAGIDAYLFYRFRKARWL